MSEEVLQPKRVAVLTGTRADYGKLKPLMAALEEASGFTLDVIVTGMHLLDAYGATHLEVHKDGYSSIHVVPNQDDSDTSMDIILARTVEGVGELMRTQNPDLLVVHGDRVEALAGAIAGALNNVRVAHVEGGEVSGTIDESLRHSVTKLSHFHFVANDEARRRVLQLGEPSDTIHVIGSPDIDVMISETLPELHSVQEHYDIGFSKYAVAMLHPVTTAPEATATLAAEYVDALIESGRSYVVIHPNNDMGRDAIMAQYARLESDERFRLLPSMRFEYFLTLLKNADFVVGNSSVGVREAGVYGVPAVDVGTRQSGRAPSRRDIIHVAGGEEQILNAINTVESLKTPAASHFGSGNSAEAFMQVLAQPRFWRTSIQKLFVDAD